MTKGRFTILLIGLVALGMATFAVWFRSKQTDQLQAAWGSPALLTIQRAQQVELLLLDPAPDSAPPAGSADSLAVDGAICQVQQTTDISDRPGLIHLRHALSIDAGYVWTPSPPVGAADWQFAFRFHHDRGSGAVESVTLAVDQVNDRIMLVEQRHSLATVLLGRINTYLADERLLGE